MWATTKNLLGIAFSELGRRENKMELFEQAAEAFREALEERERKEVQVDWRQVKADFDLALWAVEQRREMN